VLGRYRLHRRLGTGAFGTVWLASDERLERDVAVKILPRERVIGGRFEREARAAARLAHPGIVTLYEASVDDDGAYLVSELVRGHTLDQLLQAGQLSDQDIVSVGIALCDALEHAHGLGVVHRDVKPSNVLVPERPATPAQVVKLTDFGVARVIGGDSLTMTGDVVGTLAYMAPEQAEGLEAGANADLYSLALVLYEALTGVNPVRMNTAAQRARRLGAHLPPLRRQRRELPHELGQAIDMALRPRPRERGRICDLRSALVTVQEHVDDLPGVVAGPWLTRDHAPAEPTARRREVVREPEPSEPSEPSGRDVRDGDAEPRNAVPAWPERGLGALATAFTAAWLSSRLLAPAPIPPALAAILAGGLTLFLPRAGWLALTAAACGTALAQGHAGLALVALLALLVPVGLMFRRPLSWSLPAAAPALGLFGLAGAWPALAARAPTAWRRAALGATGWIWLLLATPVAGRTLYLRELHGIPPPSNWAGSVSATLNHVLLPILSSGVLVSALVWAVGAAVLPWLVLGRTFVLDFVRAVVWAAMLTSATAVAITAVHGSDAVPAAPSAAVGGVLCVVVALAPVWLEATGAAWPFARRAAGPGAQFP
jgi:serine/threonine protein kinase